MALQSIPESFVIDSKKNWAKSCYILFLRFVIDAKNLGKEMVKTNFDKKQAHTCIAA